MVGHLEDVRPQGVRASHQVPLRVALDVTGQQDGPPRPCHAQHDGQLVPLPVRPAVGAAGRRMQHLDRQAAEPRPLTGDRAMHRHTLGERIGDERLGSVIVGRRSGPELADHDVVEHVGQSVEVVGIRVGQDDEVDPVAAGASEVVDRRPVGPAVHEQPHARRLHEDRVPLPDVDGHDAQARRHRRSRSSDREAEQGDHGDRHTGRSAGRDEDGAPG